MFRNYERAELFLEPGVTVLYGENAQGKTNLLEAVYLCCLGRSHRTSKDAELVRWGSLQAQVVTATQSAEGAQEVWVRLCPGGVKKKDIRINQTPVQRIGELMGHINAVMFSPEDLRLVKDGPDGRRRFLDMTLSQQQPAYFYALQRYHRALSQRNELLRKLAGSPTGALSATLEEWDALLVETGAQVIQRRAAYLERLAAVARQTHAMLSGGKETLTLRYTGRAQNEAALRQLLRAARNEDLRRMTTTVGPHRDDFLLQLDGHDARTYGSQGQQRTAALSIKLAEIEVMRDALKKKPILLLDDVMSELDVNRRNMLLSAIGNVQTLITCTHISDLGGAAYEAAYRVDNGALCKQ